ncbi:Cytokinin dehydrogenase [Stylosanthes scabra]|uniref:cytokinin dehydrogenase n=1 Tax=Stylosanthes scabra TaxID=79078 RepID=A0ABU6ZS51_9FABA|nr:Cytokinin dehydrogenase [Stylosanthes scabra]
MARLSSILVLLLCTISIVVVVTNAMIVTNTCPILFDDAPTPLSIANKFDCDNDTLTLASTDYGFVIHEKPLAVLQPTSPNDITELIKLSNSLSTPFKIAARGQAHSVYGQAQAPDGIVVNMTHLNRHSHGKRIVIYHDKEDPWKSYADVGGEQVWNDVMLAALEYGLTPLSFTDSLFTSVAGTLVNAGVGGQVFKFGPQISTAIELDVITGKGDHVTCSAKKNSKLFYAVLGGLGQFGIITRARIALGPAPKRVRWLRLLYNDFSVFTKDEEQLIKYSEGKDSNGFDFIQGFLKIVQWPDDLSFYPMQDVPRINSLTEEHKILYVLELAKYYDDSNEESISEDVENLIKGLKNVPTFKFEKDVPYEGFLNRYVFVDALLAAQGLAQAPKSWLDLFVPGSRISDINEGVFKEIIYKQNVTAIGIMLVFPMNKTKWHDKMSVAIPDEEIFYLVSLLHYVSPDKYEASSSIKNQVLNFCKTSDINIKAYLPKNKTHEEWVEHFGSKWQNFKDAKDEFDPKRILAPGQGVFK